jgi:hypothetical protein
MKYPRPIILLIVVTGLLVGTYFFLHRGSSSTDSIARQIVSSCEKSGADHAECYEAKVPELYPRLSVEHIFDVVRTIRQTDRTYQFCHVLAHKIGERVVSEDPNGWVEAISLNPFDGLCSNGYIHGIVGGRFRSEVLDTTTMEKFMPDFIRACEPRNDWDPSSLSRAICYHGMGHLADYITNADLPKALDFCSQVAPEEYRRVCIQGVFMQIYQPLEPDDFALIAQMKVSPTKKTVRTFCAAFKHPIDVGSCLEESWPLFQDSIFDGTGAASFCSGQPNATETDQCYVSISSIIGRTSLGQPQKTAAACDNFSPDRREVCYSFSASAVLEEDLSDAAPAIALCQRAGEPIASECLSDLLNHSNFTFGNNTAAFGRFCDALPEYLRSECRQDLSSGTVR